MPQPANPSATPRRKATRFASISDESRRGHTGALLIALAVEGPLPAYAATVEEVKREKDAFFGALTVRAGREAEAAGLAVEVDVRPGHAVEDYLLGSTADRVAGARS